jgi:hypothetical protein
VVKLLSVAQVQAFGADIVKTEPKQGGGTVRIKLNNLNFLKEILFTIGRNSFKLTEPHPWLNTT